MPRILTVQPTLDALADQLARGAHLTTRLIRRIVRQQRHRRLAGSRPLTTCDPDNGLHVCVEHFPVVLENVGASHTHLGPARAGWAPTCAVREVHPPSTIDSSRRPELAGPASTGRCSPAFQNGAAVLELVF